MSNGGISRQELSSSLIEELDLLTGDNKKIEKSITGTEVIKSVAKTPVNVKRIDGKTIINHAPLFDSGAWDVPSGDIAESNTSWNAVTPNRLELKVTKEGRYRYKTYEVRGLKRNTMYTLYCNHNGLIGIYRDYGFSSIVPRTSNKTITFTTGDYENIEIWLGNLTVTVGEYFYENMSLVEGTQSQPFVANVKGVTNPTIVNETNNTSLVLPTTLYDGEYVEQNAKGELVKYKKYNETTLTADNINPLSARNDAGFKSLHLNMILNGKTQTQTVVKYNGAILQRDTATSKPDTSHLHSNQNTLYIAISNEDSGWGQSYTPTIDEIKAYFLGWKMYATDRDTAYNGTGTKHWYPIALISDTFDASFRQSNTPPSVQAPQNQRWQPYRLIYELATPVQEVIRPYSDLTLEKGENGVRVYSGRIVNEKIKASSRPNGFYYINAIDDGIRVAYKTINMLGIYKNNVLDNLWSISPFTHNGETYHFGKTSIFDKTASYTVDYEPLYTWEVTAPIDSVQLQYFETLQSVTNELVHDVAKQHDYITRMLENVISEDSGIEWITPTFLNGAKGSNVCRYGKDKDGTVYVYIYVNITATAYSMQPFFVLPKGYRPKDSFYVSSIEYFLPNRYSGIVAITPQGSVEPGTTTAISTGTIISFATFKAEQ